MLGPATNENARLPLTSELPSTYCSRGTSVVNRTLMQTKNATVSAPVRKATT